MNILEFMSDSPWLSFFLALIVAKTIRFLVALPFRAMNIFKHGWPPAHCNSDGKLKDEQ